MLEFQCDPETEAWSVALLNSEWFPTDLPEQLGPHVFSQLKTCIVQMNWGRYEVRISLHERSDTSACINWRKGKLTITLLDTLGRAITVRAQTTLPELIASFEPTLSPTQSDHLNALCGTLAAIQPAAPMVLDELPQSVSAIEHPWRPVVRPGTFRVAYHEEWRLERSLESQYAWNNATLCLSDRTALHIMDLKTGRRRAHHPELALLTAAPDFIAADSQGHLYHLDPQGKCRWQQRAQGLTFPHQVLGIENELFASFPDGELARLDGLTGDTAWRWRAPTEQVQLISQQGELLYTTDLSGLLSCVDKHTGQTRAQYRLPGRPLEWLPSDGHSLLLCDHPPDPGFSITCLDTDGCAIWFRRFSARLITYQETRSNSLALILSASHGSILFILNILTGEITQHVHLTGISISELYAFGDWFIALGEKGEALIAPMSQCDQWRPMDPRALEAGQRARLYDRGDFWIIGHQTTHLVAAGTGRYLGRLLDRPCEHIGALSNGDLLVILDDAVARFRLGGHLSLVDSTVPSNTEKQSPPEGG